MLETFLKILAYGFVRYISYGWRFFEFFLSAFVIVYAVLDVIFYLFISSIYMICITFFITKVRIFKPCFMFVDF